MRIDLDLKLFLEGKLTLSEFTILSIINEYPEIEILKELLPPEDIKNLEDNGWMKHLESGEYVLRSKGKDLFKSKVTINFDEFWDVFPIATPSGRVLRATSKTWGGKSTRDYTVCRRKYLSKIKTVEAHNQVVSIVRARVASKDYEYMNNIETYINQEKWQQDAKYLTQVPQGVVNRIV